MYKVSANEQSIRIEDRDLDIICELATTASNGSADHVGKRAWTAPQARKLAAHLRKAKHAAPAHLKSVIDAMVMLAESGHGLRVESCSKYVSSREQPSQESPDRRQPHAYGAACPSDEQFRVAVPLERKRVLGPVEKDSPGAIPSVGSRRRSCAIGEKQPMRFVNKPI